MEIEICSTKQRHSFPSTSVPLVPDAPVFEPKKRSGLILGMPNFVSHTRERGSGVASISRTPSNQVVPAPKVDQEDTHLRSRAAYSQHHAWSCLRTGSSAASRPKSPPPISSTSDTVRAFSLVGSERRDSDHGEDDTDKGLGDKDSGWWRSERNPGFVDFDNANYIWASCSPNAYGAFIHVALQVYLRVCVYVAQSNGILLQRVPFTAAAVALSSSAAALSLRPLLH